MLNRQHIPLILQQHDTLAGNLAGCSIVSFRAKEAVGTLTVHRRAEVQSEHAAHLLVKFLGGIAAFLNGLLVGIGQIVVVVGVCGTHGQTVGPRTKLHVETVADSLIHVVTAAPVRNHHTVEAPLLLQYLVEQRLVVTVVLILIKVIGTHDGPCPTLTDCSLEGWQIDFTQGAVRNNDVHLMPIFLIVVQRIVLDTGRHTLRLQALHVRHHHT